MNYKYLCTVDYSKLFFFFTVDFALLIHFSPLLQLGELTTTLLSLVIFLNMRLSEEKKKKAVPFRLYFH